MIEALCVYGVNCAMGIKVGCIIWAFLCMGGGGVALDQGNVGVARKYGLAMVILTMIALLFPNSETWQEWLEIARRP